MRKISRYVFVLLLAAAVSGCSGKPSTKLNELAKENTPKTPKAIVEAIYDGYRMDQTAGLEQYFSSRIPKAMVLEFLEREKSRRQLVSYAVKRERDGIMSSTVTVAYTYRPVLERNKGLILRMGDETTTKRDYVFTRERKAWKIAMLGDREMDWKVESSAFFKCLNAVMDLRIAQEQYRGGHATYASNTGVLASLVPVRISACREVRFEDADRNTYTITAQTDNNPPCDIMATPDGAMPMRPEGCATLKALKPPAEKKAPKKSAKKALRPAAEAEPH